MVIVIKVMITVMTVIGVVVMVGWSLFDQSCIRSSKPTELAFLFS